MTLLAYHNDQAVKDFYLARVRAHREADEIIHGTYWEEGKGCAVGCTVHSSDHGAYERELGIPRILARLEDGIFESLTNGKSKEWPEQFLAAIRTGADLSLIWPRFAVWLLTDKWHGVLQYSETQKEKITIQNVSDAYQSIVEGSKKEIDWNKLRATAADAAAAYATAADAAAAYAADAAATATAAAAADAASATAYTAAAAATAAATAAAAGGADAAATATAAAAAKIKHREAQAEKLLELLRAA